MVVLTRSDRHSHCDILYNRRYLLTAMKNHFLGKHCHQSMAAAAEKALDALTYTGESKRWTFEKYITKQQEQFHIMNNLAATGSYRGIDEGSKVWKLLGGINTNDPLFMSVKAQIIASPTHLNDYDLSVGLFNTALSMGKSAPGVASINAVGVAGQGPRDNSKDKDIPCDMSVELRYYKKKEYDKLNAAQRQGLYRKQQAAKQRKRAAGLKKFQIFESDSDSESDDEPSVEQRNSNIKKLQGKTQPGSSGKSKKNAKHKRKGKGKGRH